MNSPSKRAKKKGRKRNPGGRFQIRHTHRADRKQVCPSDKHLFHISAEQRITQSIDRKQQWMECVTVAYEAGVSLSDSQSTSQGQLAPLRNEASGQ